MFKFKSYNFIPSYDYKNKSMLQSLTEIYQPLFIKYINKEIFKDEEITLMNGIHAVTSYIIVGLEYRIKEDFQSKTSVEKKAQSLLNILKYYSNNEFRFLSKEDVRSLAEDTVYEALGMITGKQFKQISNSSNFILYCKDLLFYKFLNYLEKRVGEYGTYDDQEFSLSYSDKLYTVEKLIDAHFIQAFGENIANRVRECLLHEKIDDDLLPYVEFLANKEH